MRGLLNVIDQADAYDIRVIRDEGQIKFLDKADHVIRAVDNLDAARDFLGLCDAHPGMTRRRAAGQDKAFFEAVFAAGERELEVAQASAPDWLK